MKKELKEINKNDSNIQKVPALLTAMLTVIEWSNREKIFDRKL